MAAPQAVLDLIERFERNREGYRSGHQQTALRRQRQIDTLVYELGVYPAEPRRMAVNGGRRGEEEIGIVGGIG